MGNLPSINDIGPMGSTPDLDAAVSRSRAQTTRVNRRTRAGGVAKAGNLLDLQHGTLPWLALIFVAYFGLVSVQLHARVGGHRGG
jgi:hypothetical protein